MEKQKDDYTLIQETLGGNNDAFAELLGAKGRALLVASVFRSSLRSA